jgi:hypothetical protein
LSPIGGHLRVLSLQLLYNCKIIFKVIF